MCVVGVEVIEWLKEDRYWDLVQVKVVVFKEEALVRVVRCDESLVCREGGRCLVLK